MTDNRDENSGAESSATNAGFDSAGFDAVLERRDSDCLKWRLYDEDVLPLWVADMDFRSPEAVIRALGERVEHGVFGYPEGILNDPRELCGLRTLLIERMAERYHWQIQPEDILFIPGVVTAFNLACHAVKLSQGADSGLLIQPPVYPPILQAAGKTGLQSQEAPLAMGSDGQYAVDWQAFSAAFTSGTRMFLLCNPHNPTGRVFRQDELERMAELCLKNNVLICSDEIHCDLVYQGQRHFPIASLDPEIARRTITLMAPSKTFNLAGLASSFAIIQNADLRKQYLSATQGLVGWVNLMGLVAAEAAYREGQAWLDQLLVYLQANRDFLFQYINRELPGINMASPEGTYLAWLDCRQAGIEGNPYHFFLKQARVALNDGATFGPGGEGFVRLNFGCPRPILVQALERMKQALSTQALAGVE